MRSRMGYASLVLSTALALVFAVSVGSYWVDDAIVFALVSCALFAILSRGPRTEGPLEYGFRPEMTLPRSRIVHYVLVSHIRSDASTTTVSANPFERALLKVQGWRTLSAEELKIISSGHCRSPTRVIP